LNEISASLSSLKDTDAIIKSVFKFVQTHIKYIDIENGIYAYKPRDRTRYWNRSKAIVKTWHS
jgi:hypothetical protein